MHVVVIGDFAALAPRTYCSSAENVLSYLERKERFGDAFGPTQQWHLDGWLKILEERIYYYSRKAYTDGGLDEPYDFDDDYYDDYEEFEDDEDEPLFDEDRGL